MQISIKQADAPQSVKNAVENILLYALGCAIHYGHDITEPFEISSKKLDDKGLYKSGVFKLLDTFLKRVGNYKKADRAANGQKIEDTGHCYHYQFTDEFFKCDFKSSNTKPKDFAIDYDFNWEVVAMTETVLKDIKVQTLRGSHIKTTHQADHHLNAILTENITRSYVSKRLSIDTENKTYQKNGLTLPIPNGDIDAFIKLKVFAAQKAGFYILDELRQGHFYITCSPTNNRLNSSFTSIAEILIPYIRIDNQFLKGIDVANSQFLLLSHLLENCTPQSEKRLLNFIYSNDFHKTVIGKDKTHTVSECIDCLRCAVSKIELTADFYEFLSESFKGTLYTSFDVKTPRNVNKIAFFAILFGKCKTSDHAKKFKKRYLSVYRITNEFKASTHYSILSVFLQYVETTIFVEHILKLLYNSEIKPLTRHDSVYAKNSQFKAMIKEIKPFFNQIMGNDFKIDGIN